jgi:hypothetical protein
MGLVKTDVSEELSASFIRITKLDELGTTLALTSQKTPFFIVTAVKTSNLTYGISVRNRRFLYYWPHNSILNMTSRRR